VVFDAHETPWKMHTEKKEKKGEELAV